MIVPGDATCGDARSTTNVASFSTHHAIAFVACWIGFVVAGSMAQSVSASFDVLAATKQRAGAGSANANVRRGGAAAIVKNPARSNAPCAASHAPSASCFG